MLVRFDDLESTASAIRSTTERGTKPRLKKPLRWLHPKHLERKYARELRAWLKRIEDAVLEILETELPSVVADAQQQLQRYDTWAQDLDRAFEKSRAAVERLGSVAAIESITKETARDVSSFNKQQRSKVVKHALGVDVFTEEPWLADEMTAWSKENVSLIKGLPQSALERIQRTTTDAVRQGKGLAEIRTRITKDTRIVRRRVDLIATDQVQKLNGQLTQRRQQDLGVTHYIWRTSRDERVRNRHTKREGVQFAWNSPPAETADDGHPGQPIRCRCGAEPDFSHLAEKLNIDPPVTLRGGRDESIRAIPGGGFVGNARKEPAKSKQFRDGLRSAEADIAPYEYERSHVLDDDGEVLYSKTSREFAKIRFTRNEAQAIRGKTMTHNHPRGTSLSPQDFMFGVSKRLREIRAVSTTSNLEFSAVFTDKALNASIVDAHRATKVAIAKADHKLTQMLRTGAIDYPTFQYWMTHHVYKELAKQGWVKYTWKPITRNLPSAKVLQKPPKAFEEWLIGGLDTKEYQQHMRAARLGN